MVITAINLRIPLSAHVNKVVPYAWLLSGALEVWRLRLWLYVPLAS